MERLRQVVVATAREGTNAVHRVSLRAPEDDHRHVAIPRPAGLAFTQAPADIKIVEQDEVRPGPLGELEGLVALPGADDVEAVVGQMSLEEPGDARLRVGDEQSC